MIHFFIIFKSHLHYYYYFIKFQPLNFMYFPHVYHLNSINYFLINCEYLLLILLHFRLDLNEYHFILQSLTNYQSIVRNYFLITNDYEFHFTNLFITINYQILLI